MAQLELVDFPFDQYQRYRITQQIVESLRRHLDRPCLDVLDVGGFFRSLSGEEMLPVARFLPEDNTTVVDLVRCRIPTYVQGSGARLPFSDSSFHVVSSCDTLEHVPSAERRAFIGELLRVAARCVILAAPFDDERTRLGEQIIFDYVKAFHGAEQPQLQEHLENGLPDRQQVRAWLGRWGYAYADFPSGYLHHWLPMMLLKQYLFGHPGTERLHTRLDRYYNLFFSERDQRAPGYRHVFVIVKSPDDEGLIAHVSQAFQPQAGSPADDGLSLARSLLTLIEWEREWQREREQARVQDVLGALSTNAEIQELVARSKELEQLRELLARSVHPGVAPVRVELAAAAEPTGKGVLLLSARPFDHRMPASAARCWELAQALARVLGDEDPVTLVGGDPAVLSHPGITLLPYEPEESWEELVCRHRIVIVQGSRLAQVPELSRAIVAQGRYLVVDLYDPLSLVGLQDQTNDAAGYRDSLINWSALAEQIRLADFLVCADERGRDFWLGLGAGHSRLNPLTFQDDLSLRRFIDLVPNGLPGELPVHRRPALKGAHDKVAPSDRVVLWLGALDGSTDPLMLLQAWSGVVAQRPDAKLLFISPELRRSGEPTTMVARRALRFSDDLDLTGRSVFFRPEVPYWDRASYLLEADVGVYLHAPHLVAWYAGATPLLDYIWASLPLVATAGSSLARRVDLSGLGHVIESGDVQGLQSAILVLLAEPRERRRQAFAVVADGLTWERVAEPLVQYCRAPWRAGDKSTPEYEDWSSTAWPRLVMDLAYAKEYNERLRRHIDELRGGRAMRLAGTAQKLVQRVRRGRHRMDEGSGH